MENLFLESSTISDVDLFEYGLSMGVLLMIEVFGFKERTLTKPENK